MSIDEAGVYPEFEPDPELKTVIASQLEPTSAEQSRRLFPWRYGQVLWLASVVASVLVMPYSIAVLRQAKEVKLPPEMIPAVMMAEFVIEAILSLLMIWLGLGLGRSIGLIWPPLEGWGGGTDGRRRMWQAVLSAGLLGLVSAGLILGLSRLMKGAFEGAPDIESPAWWSGLLASLGAGVREEIWLRLGVMTFFVWLCAKMTRQPAPGAVVIWTANVVACLLFGAMHLPQAAQLIGLSGPVVAYVLIANGLPGLIFGWLYWRKGLIAAMLSHTLTDVVLKAILPLLGFA
jgi:hypothetical protein